MSASKKIMQRIEALAKISDERGQITRTFASPAMRRANERVARWMREVGMKTRTDAIGNLIGRYEGERTNAKILLLGSHLDTVRNAGKFDGPLGVMLAIACVEHLHRRKIRLPFAIEVIGFADEEGVRYQTTYLGSRVLAGCFRKKDLQRKDADGVKMADAIKRFGGDPAKLKSMRLNPKQLLGYMEAHIEQGPVLEKQNLAVGIVTAIAGQTRARISFLGQAGHAGTTPMGQRKDALCAAAEFVTAVERLANHTKGLVATVGEISVLPGAGNVIPGEARLSLDVRHEKDSLRKAAHNKLKSLAMQIARQRQLRCVYEVVHETAAVNCSLKLSQLLAQSVRRQQKKPLFLPSGAGHDAAIMAGITHSAMLFVRCRGGVSHHPDESVKTGDIQAALNVMNDFLQLLAWQYPHNVGHRNKAL
ncbi:MAG TPA: allantoate amidohydrolase [Candidatus Acidoferrum sp.]|jgi:allantoate deiminase|nr:allantoate amidohydrolase [Candidatus Acidoferrum sp.]